MIEFTTTFEDYPIGSDHVSGEVLIQATRWDWEADRIWVYAGQNGGALVPLHEDLASKVRAWLMARDAWVDMVDQEHQQCLPAAPKRPVLVPAYLE